MVFKGLSVAQNCLRPKCASLNWNELMSIATLTSERLTGGNVDRFFILMFTS